MQLWIEGYRSHNKKLSHAIESASFYYGTVLLGKRMVNNIELDIKLTKDLKKKEKAYGYCHIVDDDLNKPRQFMIELDASMKHPFDSCIKITTEPHPLTCPSSLVCTIVVHSSIWIPCSKDEFEGY